MNSWLQAVGNYTTTQNGALTHITTGAKLWDLFAMGGAYRQRSEMDIIELFSKAYDAAPLYALKCLFYLRDIRGGQGERRFFRVCLKWLTKRDPEAVRKNMTLISEYGRWDDMFALMDTELQSEMLDFLAKQFRLDLACNTPSLLGKWLPSENASSAETIALANIVRKHFGLTHKDYRKSLSKLRARINIVERLMSENRWEEIEFDKIPSRAGLIYRNAFARRDVIMQKYAAFAASKDTKVNAGALYPYDVVHKAIDYIYEYSEDETERNMINKYWDNLTDYFNEATFNGLAVVDTSGSMSGRPIEVAISLGLYCAERAKGPFANHFMTFSSRPNLVEINGKDFVENVQDIVENMIIDNTNIQAVFERMLFAAVSTNCSPEDMPKNIIVISDMEFDEGVGDMSQLTANTLMENIAQKWEACGYEMPHLIYWNVNSWQDNIPSLMGRVSYVSGSSPSVFKAIMSGKSGPELMYEVLDNERYAPVKI